MILKVGPNREQIEEMRRIGDTRHGSSLIEFDVPRREELEAQECASAIGITFTLDLCWIASTKSLM